MDYDIIVGNIFATPSISCLSPDARKEFVRHEIDGAYIKLPFLTELSSKLLGKGLVFSEGEEWKRKRRIFSAFFTYEFINSKIDDIARICDQCLD